MRLEPFEAWFDLPESGALLPQVRDALQRRLGDGVEPLRWAITAAEAGDSGGRRLRIEAVLLHLDAR
jgi:hypothetical protein